MDNDPRIEEARNRDLVELADVLQIEGLMRNGHEYTGPCPRCGGDDRFSINVRKNVWNCRICKIGGDAIALVQHVLGMEFMPAIEYLAGKRQEISEEELRKRREKAARERERRDKVAEGFREAHIRMAKDIWNQGIEPEGTTVRAYLEIRGFTKDRLPTLPRCLRFHRSLPYMVQDGKEWREVHRGPAMLAIIATPDGKGSAVHRTWIDLDRPKGKAFIGLDAKGKELNPKTVLGSKKGGAIRLYSPKPAVMRHPVKLYMGEGIETTLTALVGGDPGYCYWAGVDLGNMTGKVQHGEGLKYAGRPDLTDERAFVPPRGIDRLIYIQDGDSHAKLTYAQLVAGIRRAMVMRPGLTGAVIPIDGKDLNNVFDADGDGKEPGEND